jgi:hypothetical protein
VTTLAVGQVLTSVRFKVQALLSLVLATAVALSTVQFVDDVREFRATATVPLCWVAERFGRVINGYTDFIRPGDLSLLAPDLGGTALTSSFHIIDLAGLGDRRIAEFYGAGDMAGLRDYIFNDVKPTVVHFHDVWGTMTGLVSEPRLTRDYYPIIEGDFVRKDAVTGPTQLAGLRAYAAAEVPIVLNRNSHALRRSCGPTLHVAQTPQHA